MRTMERAKQIQQNKTNKKMKKTHNENNTK